jgi:hypothetical protein
MPAQYSKFKHQDLEEMEQIGTGMQDGTKDE